MVSRRASLLLVALAVVAVASAVLAGSSTTSYTYSGGLPFCTQCGGTSQYACSSGVGTWKNQYQVASPVPTGSVATSVSVTLLGSYACNYTPNVVEIDINDVPVNILQTTSDQACACNTCDGPVTFASDYAPFGLPNFKYSGNNNVTINIMAGTICLNLVNITISWDTPTLPGTSTAIHRWNVIRYTSPRVCNTFGYDNSNQISLTFQDPLPSGALVLLANVQVFGSYWCYSSSSISPTITATLVSATISSIKLAAKGSSAKCNYSDQCDGGYWLPSSPMYQTGWPNYRYGASNTLRIDTTYYPRIGQVALYLTYYIPGSDAATTTIVAPLSSE